VNTEKELREGGNNYAVIRHGQSFESRALSSGGCSERKQTKATKAAYGVQVVERSLTWPLVKERIFCDLPKSMLDELDGISFPSTYSRDAVLFGAGQDPRGAFVIRNGRVKLSTSSSVPSRCR
jgi:hypothetical protein